MIESASEFSAQFAAIDEVPLSTLPWGVNRRSVGVFGLRLVRGLPCVETASEIRYFAKAGAAQDAGGNGAAITAFAVDDEEFAGVELVSSVTELTERNANRVFDGAERDLARFPDVEYRKMVFFLFAKFGEFLRGDLRDVVELAAGLDPARDAAFEIGVDVLDTDAGEAKLGFAEVIGVFADEDDVLVEAENAGGPGGVLAGERNVDGAGDVSDGELHGGASVEDDGAFGLEAEDLGCAGAGRAGEAG